MAPFHSYFCILLVKIDLFYLQIIKVKVSLIRQNVMYDVYTPVCIDIFICYTYFSCMSLGRFFPCICQEYNEIYHIVKL